MLTLLQLVLNILVAGGNDDDTLLEIIRDFNKEYQIELNLFIDLTESQSWQFNEVIASIEQPKLLMTSNRTAVRDLYKTYNMQVLTIARMDESNLNMTLAIMEQLLWKRHYTTIIIWYDSASDTADIEELQQLFRKCWQNGYTSVLVWWRSGLYTFQPYPEIEVRNSSDYRQFTDKSDAENFHHYQVHVLTMEIPPRCFSYHNRQGRLIRTGYYYKLIESFVTHYNGSVRADFMDIWSGKIDQDFINAEQTSKGYSFIGNNLLRSDSYASSDTLNFGNCFLIAPSSKEISQSLYLLISFDWNMWLMVALVLMVLFVLIYFVSWRTRRMHRGLAGSLLQSLKVLLFIPTEGFERRTVLNFLLHLIFLLSGFFLTNFFSGNLCSMYSSRVYEPELRALKDVARTDLQVIGHTADINYYKSVKNLPAVLYERLMSGNNTVLYTNRQRLNMIYIFVALEDVVHFLLFQQTYLKRPSAKLIPEPLYSLHEFIPMLLRSPLIERFNRYLGYMKDSGILNKYLTDSQMDGVLSGNIQFFKDTEVNRSLSLSYFKYAFAVWSVGLACAFIVFLFEILRKKGKMRCKLRLN